MSPLTLSLADYGAIPDSGRDTAQAMQRILEAAACHVGQVVIDVPKGRYDFYQEHAACVPYYITNTASEKELPNVTRTIAVWMKGISELTLEGNGSLFMFHGRQTMFLLDDCTEVTVRNLRLDMSKPTVTEMQVVSVGSNFMDTVVHADSNYELADGQLAWVGDDWRFSCGPVQLFDAANQTTWRIEDILQSAELVEELGPGKLRFTYATAPIPAVGQVVQMRDGIRDQVGVCMTECRQITWEQVSFHYMHGLGIVGQFSSDLSFINLDLAPRAETGRTVAAFADFLHLSGCKGKIRVIGSRFEGAHDDAINVHGTHLRIVDRPASDQLLVRFMHPQTYGIPALREGDELELVNADSLNAYFSCKSVTVEKMSPREMLLTLDRPAPPVKIGKDVVENVTWTPEVEIAHNIFSRIPTRGILLTTRRQSIIRNNQFERIGMSGILIANDAKSWFESGRVEDVEISGNTFVDCGDATNPVILVAPENRVERKPVHKGIRIIRNRFELGKAIPYSAKSTEDLQFEHNTITRLLED